jgi:hypothetical protein
MISQVSLHTIIVEQRIIYIEQEDDVVRFRH